MNEVEFARLIDCRFPYADIPRAAALIRQGASISTNAAFCVLDEICRTGAGTDVAPGRQNELLDIWCEHFSHPLAEPLANCARRLIDERRLSAAECLNVLHLIADYRGQYAALSVVNAAYDVPAAGVDVVDEMTNAIRAAWESNPDASSI
jgi:hypothetical protein